MSDHNSPPENKNHPGTLGVRFTRGPLQTGHLHHPVLCCEVFYRRRNFYGYKPNYYGYILDHTSIQMYSVHYVFVFVIHTELTVLCLSIDLSIYLISIDLSLCLSVRMYALPTSVKSFEILNWDIIRYDSEQRRKSFGASKNLGVMVNRSIPRIEGGKRLCSPFG